MIELFEDGKLGRLIKKNLISKPESMQQCFNLKSQVANKTIAFLGLENLQNAFMKCTQNKMGRSMKFSEAT